MLREDLENSGDKLFKRRSYIPLILYALATIAVVIDSGSIFLFNSISWSITCMLVSLLGLFIRVATIGLVAKNTSGRNTTQGQIAESLNTTGMYSMVRHPLYLGNFFMWMGLILYVAIPWVIILSVFFFWFVYERIMLAEERFIRSKFKEAFEEWARKTPAFFPVKLRWKTGGRRFSVKKVMRREYSGILALGVSFVYLDTLKNYVKTGNPEPAMFWIVFGIICVILWLTFRSLRKWTNILESKEE